MGATEFMRLRKERGLKPLQPRNQTFAVAVPAKLIVIDLLAVFAKVVFDRLEKTISRLETSQRKFLPLCSDCACHCITTLRTFPRHAHRILREQKVIPSAGPAEHLPRNSGRA